MALTYNKTTRKLSIKGVLTLNNGSQINLVSEDIVSYSFTGSTGYEGLPLGTVEAVSYNLTLKNVGRRFTPSQLDNAEVHMYIGLWNGSAYVYNDFGVWYVNDSSAPEQSVAITLNGFDALATRFSAYFEDDGDSYPSTIGSLAQTVCTAAGIKLARTDFLNAAVAIKKMPDWPEETTLRDILSYCAICAAGFVRMTKSGQVDIVSYSESNVYSLGPGMYQTFTATGGYEFDFNGIEVFLDEDDEERSKFYIDSSITPNATNTIQIDYNPLLTESIAQSIANELKGISLDSGELMWGGDPAVQLGDIYEITDLKGNVHKIMVTSQNFNFGGGLNAVETCSLPALNTQSSATYSTSTNMYDANGNIRATRISGLDKKVIAATTGHFENLTAESAEIDNLLVSLLNAVNLIANMIDAKVIKSGSITTDQLAAGSVTAEKIDTDTLEATSIDAVTAHIEKIVSEGITTDSLYAALAKISNAEIGTADIGWAQIKDLITGKAIITEGVSGQLFISRLAVTEANMVSLTVGELVVKGEDGSFYAVSVDEDGNIVTTLKQIVNDDIGDLTINAGEKLIEGSVTAACLNATDIFAENAIIKELMAANIDVDTLFSRDAFVTKLTTSQIVGDKSITIMAQDIAANTAAIASQNTDLANAVTKLEGDIADIQSQVDGSITTWYYDGEPTAENEPAVNWDTEALKEVHQGDLYYDKQTGYSYRWLKEGDAWAWVRIADTDISSALAKASTAQDTADAKKRIFYTQPTPPYDAGDLWVQGSEGDIYVCINPKLAEFSFVQSDWEIASKYTDDTVANEAKDAADAAQSTADAAQSAADTAQTSAENAGNTASKAVEYIGDIPNHVEIRSDGLYLKDQNGASTLKINSASVSIGTVANSAADGYSQFTASYVQFGNYQLRKSTDGGLVFKLKG